MCRFLFILTSKLSTLPNIIATDAIQVITGGMNPFGPVGENLPWFFPPVTNISAFPGLSKGCTSTEADVWLYNGTLYVRFLTRS